jgi:hypothetical protein
VTHAVPRRPQRPRILHPMGPQQPPIPPKLHQALRKWYVRRRSEPPPASQGPIRRRLLVDIRGLSNNKLLIRVLCTRSVSTHPPNIVATHLPLALAITEAAINVTHRIHTKYPNDFARLANSSDALSIFRSGRLISSLAVEGLHLIGESYTKLRSYHSSDVRLITFTHNCHNAYADAALVQSPDGRLAPSQPQWGGVSESGQVVVREMNRLGNLVDLSHPSANTMRAVLRARNRGKGNSLRQ